MEGLGEGVFVKSPTNYVQANMLKVMVSWGRNDNTLSTCCRCLHRHSLGNATVRAYSQETKLAPMGAKRAICARVPGVQFRLLRCGAASWT